jgi:biopolymer transport protein TolR
MSGRVEGAVRMQAEPNVTPMIDVLMVLLIIFMVIVPMSRRSVDVQLPVPAGGEAAPGIVLEVGPGGRLALNRQPVAESQLGARLRAVYAGRPDKSIIVHGDGAARYQEVVAAIDSARGAGVRVVGRDPRREQAPTVH